MVEGTEQKLSTHTYTHNNNKTTTEKHDEIHGWEAAAGGTRCDLAKTDHMDLFML